MTTAISLTENETIDLKAALDFIRPIIDAAGGAFGRTPYQTIRDKFPRDDDVFMPDPKTIYLTDLELRALGEMLEVMREIKASVNESVTAYESLYDKVIQAIVSRATTFGGKLGLTQATLRDRASGAWGLLAAIGLMNRAH
jgi:hypothetical protein